MQNRIAKYFDPDQPEGRDDLYWRIREAIRDRKPGSGPVYEKIRAALKDGEPGKGRIYDQVKAVIAKKGKS